MTAHVALLLQALTAPVPSSAPQYIGDAIVIAIVAGKGLLDRRGGKRRDSTLIQQFSDVHAGIAEVRAFVVGPDGENGIRGDVREIKKRVIGLEDRERDRLEHAAARPPQGFSISPPNRSNAP